MIFLDSNFIFEKFLSFMFLLMVRPTQDFESIYNKAVHVAPQDPDRGGIQGGEKGWIRRLLNIII